MWLSAIPEKTFETVGVCFGFSGSVLIAVQIHAEWANSAPSSLSPVFLAGFLVNYFFWLLYGIRFRRFAVWFVNIFAVLLQLALLCVVLLK
jgi:uncharacterized protein with PQ loop repeat